MLSQSLPVNDSTDLFLALVLRYHGSRTHQWSPRPLLQFLKDLFLSEAPMTLTRVVAYVGLRMTGIWSGWSGLALLLWSTDDCMSACPTLNNEREGRKCAALALSSFLPLLLIRAEKSFFTQSFYDNLVCDRFPNLEFSSGSTVHCQSVTPNITVAQVLKSYRVFAS